MNDTQVADSFQNCENIEGLTPSINNEVTTLTMFANEACDQVSIRGAFSAKPSELYNDDKVVTDVKDYFSRPHLVSSYTLTGTRYNVGNFTLTNSFLQTYLYNFSRIQGAFGYRATICFRFQIASTPFLAGRLRASFQPFYDPATSILLHNRLSSAPALSQLPGVELDLTEQTNMILKVPFVHPKNYFMVNGGLTDCLGTVSLFTYLPVSRATGSPFPAGSVYIWAEDFELIGASGQPTSLSFPTSVFALQDTPLPDVIEAQAGNFSASTKEERVLPGTLSKILDAGSRLTMVASALVPTISSFAGPTSWALREISNIAASYGWSKPINATPVDKRYVTCNTNQFNCDGPDNAHVLGAFSDNSISPYPGFAGTDVDEMSMSYISSIYSLIYNGTLLSTITPNNYMYACDLSPMALFYQPGFNYRADPGSNAFWPSTVYGLSSGFTLFRGGLKFKIKAAKTKMHTGRLLLGFQPREPTTAGSFTVPLDPLSLNFKSVVWDLREGNEMEFDCPFLSNLPYLPVEFTYGTFFILVLEPFSGPGTVGLNMPFCIEVAACNDFELAGPRGFASSPAPLTTPIYAQSGAFQPYSDNKSGALAHLCIGEKINSVKQIINRASLQEMVSTRALQRYWARTDLPIYVSTSIRDDYATAYRYYYYCYGLNRGGVCYDFVPYTKDTTLTAYRYSGSISSPVNVAVVSETNNVLHVKRPYYNYASRTINYPDPADRAVLVGDTAPTTTISVAVYQRTAEDFQFGYFIGFPPMVYPTLVSATVSAFTAAVSAPP